MPARKVDLDELRRLHGQGWHRDELAAHFGVDPSVVTKARRSLGLPLDPPRRSPLAGRRSTIDREELARLLEEGKKNAELAAHFGVSLATVSRARRALGVPTHFLTPERVAWIEERLEDGWSFAEISRTEGVDVETLRRRWPGRSWTPQERAAFVSETRLLHKSLRRHPVLRSAGYLPYRAFTPKALAA